MNIYKDAQAGYVALTSALVIAALLLAVSAAVSSSGFAARFSQLDTEFKKQSLNLAEACADLALVELARNAAYVPPAGGQDHTVSGATCTIVAVDDVAGSKRVRSTAQVKDTVSNIEVMATVTATAVTTVSWREVASF